MKLRLLTRLLAAGFLIAATTASAQVKINEIRTDHTGTDTDEYFELSGSPFTSLAGYWYIVIGDASADPRCGNIESITDLSTWSIQADGFLCLNNSSATETLTGYDGEVPLIFENSDNVTHLLVTGFTGSAGQDLDTNDDGTLDVTPWTSVVDCIGLDKGTTPTCMGSTSEEHIYCANRIGPDGAFVPGHVYRYSDTQAWAIGLFSAPPFTTDTPGTTNYSLGSPPPIFLDVTRNRCVPTTGQTATVTAKLLNTPTSVELRYSVNGGAETAVAMSFIGEIDDSTFFQGTIPAQAAEAARVAYYVLASNSNPNPTRSFDEGYFVGTTPIRSLRPIDANGSSLYRFYGARVRGRVTSPYGAFGTVQTDYYVQDATGGLNVFEFGPHQVQPVLGDDITVEGMVQQFNGKLEITSGSDCDSLYVTIHGSGTPPAPTFITPCELDDDVEGLLVRVYGGTLIDGDQTVFAGDTLYSVWNDWTDAACSPDTIWMRIDADTDVDGSAIGTSPLDLTGIAGQFKSAPPYTSGYQLQPRALSDVVFFVPPTSAPDRGAAGAWISCAPNPFVNAITFRYSIAALPDRDRTRDRQRVRLEVFDLRGRRVARVVDELADLGEHTATLERRQLGAAGAGVYFYRFEAGRTRLAGRFVMMK